MVRVSIVNVVVTAALDQRIDLDKLGKYPEIVHDPEIYGGRAAYYRSPEFTGEVTVFPSGKMISVGTKSETEAFRALELAKEYLIQNGFVEQVNLEKKIQNIVAIVDFGYGVNLEQLAQETKMVYEPEQFPGGILKLEEPPPVTVLVYSTGKAVIAGIKDSNDIKEIVGRLEAVVKPYA